MTISLAEEDAAAVFGVVAIVAGHLYAEALPDQLVRALRARLTACGLADELSDQDRLGNVLDRLAGRIRLAIESDRDDNGGQ